MLVRIQARKVLSFAKWSLSLPSNPLVAFVTFILLKFTGNILLLIAELKLTGGQESATQAR
jgi:hypothetical protein